MQVVLVRHGATDWNLQGRCQGSTDRDLSDVGVRQERVRFTVGQPPLGYAAERARHPLRQAPEAADHGADVMHGAVAREEVEERARERLRELSLRPRADAPHNPPASRATTARRR